MAAPNLHGTAIVLGDRGLLILGASGSGKSTLALRLLSQFGNAGRLARLVADDQVLVSGRDGRLLCRAPAAIEGLVELHGVGPQRLATEPAAVIDLAVRLRPDNETERLPDEAFEEVAGFRLPLLVVRERNAELAVAAVAARLFLPPFG